MLKWRAGDPFDAPDDLSLPYEVLKLFFETGEEKLFFKNHCKEQKCDGVIRFKAGYS